MLLTYCVACKHGHHDACQGGHAPPPGMLGGWKCRCEGECVERARTAGSVRPCPCCEGDGCEECDGTGKRVRTHIDAGDGVTLSVSGSAPLTPEAREALTELARIAYRQMSGNS